MNTPALHTQRLTRLYGYTRALDGFTLEVPRGRVVALLGPNGGKVCHPPGEFPLLVWRTRDTLIAGGKTREIPLAMFDKVW